MKQPNARPSQQAVLARKRALIRALIEQNGWASPAAALAPTSESDPAAVPSNIIPFPVEGLKSAARSFSQG
jgi:hypothetical protein